MSPVVAKMMRAAELDGVERKAVEAALTDRRRCAARTNLLGAAEREDHAVVILDGMASRYKDTKGGQRQIVSLLLPGDFCDIDAHLGRLSDHRVEMITTGTVAYVPRREVNSWLHLDRNLKRAILWAQYVEAATTREWVVNLGARQTLERTAHLLCELRARFRVVDPDAVSTPLPTQGDLANCLGVTTVHVHRTFATLRDRNIAHVERRRLFVDDLDHLTMLGDFDDAYLRLTG